MFRDPMPPPRGAPATVSAYVVSMTTVWSTEALGYGVVVAGSNLLEEMLARPAWHRDAACRGRGDVEWMPTQGQSADEALALCEKCSVDAECLADALCRGSMGVWGGTRGLDRRRLMRGAGRPGSPSFAARVLEVATAPR